MRDRTVHQAASTSGIGRTGWHTLRIKFGEWLVGSMNTEMGREEAEVSEEQASV